MAALNLIRNTSFLWFKIATKKFIFRTNIGSILGSSHLRQNKSSNIDVLDNLINRNLLQLKQTKERPKPTSNPIESKSTEGRSKILKKIALHQKNELTIDESINIEHWQPHEIDNYVKIVIDCNDKKTFLTIFDQIIQLKKLPSDEMILKILCFMCDDSAYSMVKIVQVVDLCREKNQKFYALSMEFAPFLAQDLWKMERFDDALATLNELFGTSNSSVKSSVLRNYRQIIFDAVQNHDETIVKKLAKCAMKIYELHKAPILLIYVWADCFYSDLFRNQEIANKLYESYEIIRKIVSNDIGWIVLSLIQQHNIDGLHRLIEQCLKFDMKTECGTCMRALFDYHYSRRDVRSCSELRRTAIQLEIPFSYEQEKQLFQLQKINPNEMKFTKQTKSTVTRFEFKF